MEHWADMLNHDAVEIIPPGLGAACQQIREGNGPLLEAIARERRLEGDERSEKDPAMREYLRALGEEMTNNLNQELARIESRRLASRLRRGLASILGIATRLIPKHPSSRSNPSL